MPWYPGQVAIGQKVFNDPVIAAQGLTVQAVVASFQKGIATTPPAITTPSTVPSPGTVTNTTGYDAIVYATATTGISKAMINAGTALGTIGPAQTGTYYVANGSSLILTYTGTLTWTWLAV